MQELQDKANYAFYSDTLGRAVIPTAKEFEAYKIKSVLYVQNLLNDGLVIEKKDNALVSAICMMTEEEYLYALNCEAGAVIQSQSIGGYSRTIEKVDLNKKKLEWLNAYCHVIRSIK